MEPETTNKSIQITTVNDDGSVRSTMWPVSEVEAKRYYDLFTEAYGAPGETHHTAGGVDAIEAAGVRPVNRETRASLLIDAHGNLSIRITRSVGADLTAAADGIDAWGLIPRLAELSPGIIVRLDEICAEMGYTRTEEWKLHDWSERMPFGAGNVFATVGVRPCLLPGPEGTII